MNRGTNVDPPAMIERIARLKAMLHEIEAEITRDNPPPDILRDFKGAVDDVRTSVWAAMTADGSQGYRSVLAQLRSARIAEMLEHLMLDLETGALPRNTPSFLSLREQVLSAADQLRRG